MQDNSAHDCLDMIDTDRLRQLHSYDEVRCLTEMEGRPRAAVLEMLNTEHQRKMGVHLIQPSYTIDVASSKVSKRRHRTTASDAYHTEHIQ